MWMKKCWLWNLTSTNNHPTEVQTKLPPRSSRIHKSSSLLITSCIDGLSVGFGTQQSLIRLQILSFAMVSGRFGVTPPATLAITVNIGYSWYGSFPVRTSYMTIPKDHISERVVPTRGLKVSGAIHLTDSIPPGVCFSIVCVTAVGPDTSKAVWQDVSDGSGLTPRVIGTFESLKSCSSGFQSLSTTMDVCKSPL